MALQFQPYPVPPPPQPRANPVASAADGLNNSLALFLQYKNQQDQLQAQKDAKLVDLARAGEEGGQNFWNTYAALKAGRNPYGTGIPAAPGAGIASPTPAATPGISVPAPTSTDPYAAIQDPYGPLPGMSTASAPNQSLMPSVSPPPMSSPAAGPAPGGAPSPQTPLDLTPEHLAQIRQQRGSKGLKEYQDQQSFLLQQKQGQADLAQKGVQNAGSLRDDYTKASLPFQTQSDNMQKIANISKQPGSPASDMALMVAYMKVLDPGVTVREGQYARLEDTAAIPDKVRDMYNSLVEGKSLKTLTDTQRRQFYSAAADVYQGSLDRNKTIQDTYTGIAQRQGLNPQDVVVPYGMQNFNVADYRMPQGAAPQTAQVPTKRTAPQSFGSVQAAESAGLPKGTIVMIGNRRAVIE